MPNKYDKILGEYREEDAGGGGGGSSEVEYGTIDGTVVGTLPMFFNVDELALKVYYLGSWITIAAVSFDSLWDSVTDVWDSTSMTWDSPAS